MHKSSISTQNECSVESLPPAAVAEEPADTAVFCEGTVIFTHQKWSGASYSDRVLNGTSFLRTNRYLAATALQNECSVESLPPAAVAEEPADTAVFCEGTVSQHARKGRYRRLVERVYKSSCEQSVCMCEDEDEEFLLQ
jgi:hypothetical protein